MSAYVAKMKAEKNSLKLCRRLFAARIITSWDNIYA